MKRLFFVGAMGRRLGPMAPLFTVGQHSSRPYTTSHSSSSPLSSLSSSPPSSRDSFLSPPSAVEKSPYHTRQTTQQRRHTGRGRESRSQHPHSARGAGRGPMKDRTPPIPTDRADLRRRLAVLVDGSNTNLIPGGCTSREQIYRSAALFSTVLPAVLQVGVPVLLRVFAHQLPSVWEPLLVGNASSSSAFGTGAGHAGYGSDAELQHDGEVLEGDGGDESLHRGAVSSSFASSSSAAAAAHNTVATPGSRGGSLSLVPLPSTTSLSPSSSSFSDESTQPRIQVEYFRVERFIPIAMQIEADARHLYEMRTLNHVEGVCYVCHEVDRALYLSLMQEQRSGSSALAGMTQASFSSSSSAGADDPAALASAAFFNQYVLDELGMAGELLADGRSKDGS